LPVFWAYRLAAGLAPPIADLVTDAVGRLAVVFGLQGILFAEVGTTASLATKIAAPSARRRPAAAPPGGAAATQADFDAASVAREEALLKAELELLEDYVANGMVTYENQEYAARCVVFWRCCVLFVVFGARLPQSLPPHCRRSHFISSSKRPQIGGRLRR
jgi:hypothetical protein